jgi:hypothetical protein
MRRAIAVTIVTLPLVCPPLAAQRTVGRLEGTVTEALASRPASAAQVLLLKLDTDGSSTLSASADARGRYHLDSLPEGRYIVQLSHPTLDSLELTMPPGTLRIAGGQTARSDFELPSGARLRELVCPGVHLDADKAIVAGHVVDAETDRPLAGAKVVVLWNEILVERKPIRIRTEKRVASVTTDREGEYRMCGIPAGRSLSMQLQYDGRAGATIRLAVSRDEGVAVRDLSLSTRSAPTIATLDSLEAAAILRRAADTTRSAASVGGAAVSRTVEFAPAPDTAAGVVPFRDELALRGDAVLTGTVRTMSGEPLSDAEVHVRDAPSSTTTDAAGRFTLGDLPSGTQLLLVRHLGFVQAELPVELRAAKRTSRDVRLLRAAVLDTARVLAERFPLAEFEYNRRTQLQGHFLTLAQIQARKAKKTSDLLQGLGGATMMGRGENAKFLLPRHDVQTGSVACRGANVVIQGVEGFAVDDVIPNQIAGIEVYPDAAAAPPKYAGRANCGVIVIWLRPGPRRRAMYQSVTETTALHYNGYL